MGERVLRGSRLGTTSYETDRNTDLAPRQEVIYDFGAPGGIQRFASCETEIDPDSPVFAAVTAALRAVAARPAT